MVGYVQNTYSKYTGSALPGLLADLGTNYKQSYVNASGVNVDFGLAVVLAVSPNSVGDRMAQLPTAPGQVFVGITIRDQFREIATVGGSSTYYYPGDTMSILTTQGAIWVTPETDVDINDPVYFRTTANGSFTTLGAFRNDDDGGDCDLVPLARFNSSASAGSPALILLPLISPDFAPAPEAKAKPVAANVAPVPTLEKSN